MASKQPRRSDLTSGLKFMAQITYTTMFVWTFFWTLTERRTNPLISTRVVGFAATKIRKFGIYVDHIFGPHLNGGSVSLISSDLCFYPGGHIRSGPPDEAGGAERRRGLRVEQGVHRVEDDRQRIRLLQWWWWRGVRARGRRHDDKKGLTNWNI